jgi:hypothetical protein
MSVNGVLEIVDVDIATLDNSPQVCYLGDNSDWIITRVKDVWSKPIWELEDGSRLTPEYLKTVVVIIYGHIEPFPLQNEDWDYALKFVGNGRKISVDIVGDETRIVYGEMNFKELYTAAMRKLNRLSDDELKQFLGVPTGTLLSGNDLQLLQNINTQLNDNSEIEKELVRANDWLLAANRFVIDGEDVVGETTIEQRKQQNGSVMWICKKHGYVLNKNGEWEYEPIPSSRTDGFIKTTRFDDKDELYTFYLMCKENATR